jgi:murein L,D-transpeptidase YafK
MKKKSIIYRITFGLLLSFTVVLSIYYFYPEESLPAGTVIDKIVVLKSQRQLLAYSQGHVVKVYTISLGGNPIGDKEVEGDKKTPEGRYVINDKNPNSGYYKNLGISYPDSNDIAHAQKLGKSAGGDIKIHGVRNRLGLLGKFHRLADWTLGCIAVTNQEMEELYNAVTIGTEIEIKP